MTFLSTLSPSQVKEIDEKRKNIYQVLSEEECCALCKTKGMVKIMETKKIVWYVLGSLVLFGIACFIVPKVTKSITNTMYKNSVKKKNKVDDEDWGPELVKKTDDK